MIASMCLAARQLGPWDNTHSTYKKAYKQYTNEINPSKLNRYNKSLKKAYAAVCAESFVLWNTMLYFFYIHSKHQLQLVLKQLNFGHR